MSKKGTKLLKPYSVSEKIFDEILLAGYTVRIEHDKDKFHDCLFGYDEKTVIVYDGLKCMIMLECVLNEHAPIDREVTYWRQCRVYKDATQETDIEDDINGIQAYYYMKKIICSHYTEEEYEERLSMFQADYDENMVQYHFLLLDTPGKIIQYDNCYKWDINGAHNDALCEIFPKAARDIKKLYANRKIKPINKKYVNYYVGTLVPMGFEKTYNWIVQRTTKKLLSGIEIAGGDLIYANTDGFIIQNPDKLIPHSTVLGEYKLEYFGPIWVYFDKNYQCYQTETGEIKGSVLHSVRNLIDLPNNKVVHYDRARQGDTYIATNITTEVINNGTKESGSSLR